MELPMINTLDILIEIDMGTISYMASVPIVPIVYQGIFCFRQILLSLINPGGTISALHP